MKAQVFILLGQSNAVGHGVPMREEDKITTPLKNVFGLSREKNQSFENEELVWSGYTSGGMNLGETQDHTYSVANRLAALWQKRIDGGANLPDLYIVHIAIGAEGVTERYMWYPKREKKLIPGVLGQADISLYPFTCRVLSLLRASFEKTGKEYEILGLHWRGGEQEVDVPLPELKSCLSDIYRELFGGFENALKKPVPVYLHRPVFFEKVAREDPTGEKAKRLVFINEVFGQLSKERGYLLFDPREYPGFNAEISGNGLFGEDLVHYTPEVNEWVAERIAEVYRAPER